MTQERYRNWPMLKWFLLKLWVEFLIYYYNILYIYIYIYICRSQWPRGLRRRSATAHLLKSWVRIPPGAWIFVCCECCVLSGRGLCDELIIRPEESYRLWCVVVCDLETSRLRRPWPALGRSATKKKKLIRILCIKLEINQGYTTMHGQPVIKVYSNVNYGSQDLWAENGVMFQVQPELNL